MQAKLTAKQTFATLNQCLWCSLIKLLQLDHVYCAIQNLSRVQLSFFVKLDQDTKYFPIIMPEWMVWPKGEARSC